MDKLSISSVCHSKQGRKSRRGAQGCIVVSEIFEKIIGKGIDKSFCSVHNIPRCSVQKVIRIYGIYKGTKERESSLLLFCKERARR